MTSTRSTTAEESRLTLAVTDPGFSNDLTLKGLPDKHLKSLLANLPKR